MGKSLRKKVVASFLMLSMVFSSIGLERMIVGNAASDSGGNAMTNLETDFAGYLYDDTGRNIAADSVLKGDADVSTIENAERYATGGYTSMADYLFSFNDAGELVRDVDYSFNGNKKTGLLYYKKELTDFELTFDYKHSTRANVGWNGVYVGMGASALGKVWANENRNFVLFAQRTDHHALNGSTTNISSLETAVVNYSAAAEKYKNDNSAWFSFKLVVEGKTAIWYIDGNKIASYTINNYVGGYIYLGTMSGETAFKNINVKELESDKSELEPDKSEFEKQFSAYYLPNGTAHNSYVELTSANVSDLWTVSGETLTRAGEGVYAAGPRGAQGASMLYFEDRYTNFELSYDFSFNGTNSTWKWIGAGFGASAQGKYYGDGDGFMAFIEQEGYRSLFEGKTSRRVLQEKIDDYYTSASTGDGKYYTYKLVVKGNNVEIYIDDYKVASTTIENYEGGYVYLFGSTPGVIIKNISLKETDYVIPELQKQFTAYYLPNGQRADKEFVPLTLAEVNDLWVVTEDSLTRSGTGDFAAGPNGVKGASMLYFKEKYTNFSLSYDFTFNGTTATWKWVAAGFGVSEVGKYYGDGDGYLAFIEQEGYRSMFDGQTSSRLAGEVDAYKALLSAGDSTWHTYKLIVKGSTIEIYLDDYEVATTTLNNYSGGYVYLFGATPGMQMKNIEIQEIEYIDLRETLNNTFISYYVGESKKVSATSELIKADASLTWTLTDDGGIKRAGTGDYRPSTAQNLAGSLLYFIDKYTEFELDFDYTFNGTTKGWRWMAVGVGASAYGKTGYHADGGTLAVVEMEGQVRTFTNNKTTLITNEKAFGGYAETLSDRALSMETVHHMRVAVKNARMYIFVDDYPVADTPLENYKGGYVYLYGFTENLEISNIEMSSIVTAELAQEVPYRSVPLGTAVSKINLPETLAVKLNGKTIHIPVEWNSPDYKSDAEGTYNFFATPIGQYSNLWLSNDAKRVQVGVTVGNTDEEVVQKFALTSVEELESYFENYYVVSEHELFEKNYWKQTYAGNTWKIDSNGVLKRTGKTSEGFGGGAKGTYGVAALYYKEKLENFEIEFDYRHGDSGWKWVSVAFGAKSIGDTYYDNGYLAWVEQEGKVRIQGSTDGESMNFMDSFPASRYIDGYADKLTAIKDGKSDEWFHYRLVVTNGVARVYINDTLWSCSLADDYKGGYVSLSLNAANTTIQNLSITNYDAKEITIASIQSTKSLGCDYIEIDKTKGDTLSLPGEMVVTDTNGYTYRLQMDWVNDQYRSGKLGTYKFAGVPILPSKMFKNPNNVTANATVKVTKVDYNPATTVKYYFDNANDMLDFTDYYSENTAEADLAVSNWEDHWTLQDGQLQRINDNFSNPTNDKFGTYRKVSRLTYNKELTGNYQIDVDYKQDTGTYMWAMICFATSDKTKFMVAYDQKEETFKPNAAGGTAVYLEKEGAVNYWGNMAEYNLDGIRLRLLQTIDKFGDYDSTKMHHMTLTVIDGIARVYIDGYDTNVAVRIPEEALGGYVSLMSNANAVTFDNFAITTLDDDAEDGDIVKAGDTTGVSFTHKDTEMKAAGTVEKEANVLGIVIPILAGINACVALIICFIVYKKKKEGK